MLLFGGHPQPLLQLSVSVLRTTRRGVEEGGEGADQEKLLSLSSSDLWDNLFLKQELPLKKAMLLKRQVAVSFGMLADKHDKAFYRLCV